jgi:hypothetical protein
MNGAEGISDIEGKIARVATSELGNERVSMEKDEVGRSFFRSIERPFFICLACQR